MPKPNPEIIWRSDIVISKVISTSGHKNSAQWVIQIVHGVVVFAKSHKTEQEEGGKKHRALTARKYIKLILHSESNEKYTNIGNFYLYALHFKYLSL